MDRVVDAAKRFVHFVAQVNVWRGLENGETHKSSVFDAKVEHLEPLDSGGGGLGRGAVVVALCDCWQRVRMAYGRDVFEKGAH